MRYKNQMREIDTCTASEWAFKLRVLRRGETMRIPTTVVRLDYKCGDERDSLSLLMPAGAYTKRAEDDLVTFQPD
jgi:hypothetical protein